MEAFRTPDELRPKKSKQDTSSEGSPEVTSCQLRSRSYNVYSHSWLRVATRPGNVFAANRCKYDDCPSQDSDIYVRGELTRYCTHQQANHVRPSSASLSKLQQAVTNDADNDNDSCERTQCSQIKSGMVSTYYSVRSCFCLFNEHSYPRQSCSHPQPHLSPQSLHYTAGHLKSSTHS